MQKFRSGSRSVRFFAREIFGEMFYPNLQSFVWRRHVGVPPRGTNMGVPANLDPLDLDPLVQISQQLDPSVQIRQWIWTRGGQSPFADLVPVRRLGPPPPPPPILQLIYLTVYQDRVRFWMGETWGKDLDQLICFLKHSLRHFEKYVGLRCEF